MGRVSRRKLKPQIEERLYTIFWDHLAAINSKTLAQEFLQSLLSDTEQVMIAKRLAIAVMLSRGYSYDYIDDVLKVSKSTIAIIDRQMITGAPGYQKAIDRINRENRGESVWDTFEELILKLSPPARKGSLNYAIKSTAGKALYKRKLQRSSL